MGQKINYAESARKLLGFIKDINLKDVENLQCYMDNFDHIRMRKGFILDAFYTSTLHGGDYQLYARREDASEPFVYSAYQKASNPSTKISEITSYTGVYEDGIDVLDLDILGIEVEWKFHDGQYIRGRVPYTCTFTIPSVFDYVEYEFSEQSVWELFLLSISWKFMPLWWHSNYARTDYIFERKDIEDLASRKIICYEKHIDLSPQLASYLNDDTILPEVRIISETEAEIRISLWNDWAGLVRKIICVERKNGTTSFMKKNSSTLVKRKHFIIY